MKSLKNISKIAVIGLVGTGLLVSGCVKQPDNPDEVPNDVKQDIKKPLQEQIKELQQEQKQTLQRLDELEGQYNASVNEKKALQEKVKSLQKQLDRKQNQLERDQKVIEDYKKELEKLKKEEAEAQNERVNSASFSTSSDLLSVRERLGDVREVFTESDIERLSGDEVSTDEGTTKYSQYLRFEDSPLRVDYAENEQDEIGDFLYAEDGDLLYEWEIDFGEGLESNIDNGELDDLEDVSINIMGNKYTFTDSSVSGDEISVQLLGGDARATLSENETTTLTLGEKDYEVTPVFISNPQDGDAEAKLSVNGEVTDALSEGKTDVVADGLEVGVEDLLVNNRDGVVSVVLGSNKIEFTDDYTDNSFSSDLDVNREDVDGEIRVKATRSGDTLDISTMTYRVNAKGKQGDLYVAPGKSLKSQLEEPQSLLSSHINVTYEGLYDVETTPVKVSPNGDGEYSLTVTNNRGNEFDVPFVSTENAFKLGDNDGDFIVSEGLFNIEKDDYVLVTDDNDESGVSGVLEYSELNEDEREVVFTNLATDEEVKATYDVNGQVGEGEIVFAGNSFDFKVDLNSSSATYKHISVDQNKDNSFDSGKAVFVVKGGGVLDFGASNSPSAPYTFDLRTLANEFDERTTDEVISFEVSEPQSDELDVNVNNGVSLVSDDEVNTGLTDYGAFVEVEDQSNSPDKLTVAYPASQRGANVRVAISE